MMCVLMDGSGKTLSPSHDTLERQELVRRYRLASAHIEALEQARLGSISEKR